MKNLKFKRYPIGMPFIPENAERDTFHIVIVSEDPLTVKIYDVDFYGNVAEVKTDDWLENKELILDQLQPATTAQLGRVKMAAYQANSTAVDVATLLADFNSLLSKLKNAGLMDLP